MKRYQVGIFLDAGHGGIDPRGNYTTFPGKCYYHKNRDFHKGGWFYEGVSNRNITYKVAEKLTAMRYYPVIVSHPYIDTSLTHRSNLANHLSTSFKRNVFISNHSNAVSSTNKARGFEIFTSPGHTKSDDFAKIYFDNMQASFKDEITYRPASDTKCDKEARFTVLTNTIMPAILTEHLFFDNVHDADLLFSEYFIDKVSDVQVKSILDFINN